jgi:uncharacterized damage-inducible protein DinB
LPFGARATENNSVEDFVKEIIATETELYKKQSDTFETKIKLIEKAWAEKDYRMVRSLSDSLAEYRVFRLRSKMRILESLW